MSSSSSSFRKVTHCIFDMDGLLLGEYGTVMDTSFLHHKADPLRLAFIFLKPAPYDNVLSSRIGSVF
ncbi:AGAP003372-PA-like protein [Anopheles sinensis]|uniref:AGAP003372-PA-like protein n=1 Tax=Anopheles sinensis TaxID=74873 RepID=A0A084WT26_ANOSI|nr:AGAP003372-PA-like protein [Anopheles sinensis]